MNQLLTTAPLTMSSREIAEMCEARHNDVVITIERLFEKGLLRESRKNKRLYNNGDNKGRPVNVYDLTKRDTLVVVSGYRDDIRAKIIDRWMELEQRAAQPAGQPAFSIPQSLPEALRLAAEQAEQITEMKPKAIAFDELANTDGVFTLRESAKLCSWPEKKFIARLLMEPVKWLYIHGTSGRKLAYSQAIQKGYVEVKEVTIFHNTTGREMYGQVMITQKGLAKLSTLLGPFSEAT